MSAANLDNIVLKHQKGKASVTLEDLTALTAVLKDIVKGTPAIDAAKKAPLIETVVNINNKIHQLSGGIRGFFLGPRVKDKPVIDEFTKIMVMFVEHDVLRNFFKSATNKMTRNSLLADNVNRASVNKRPENQAPVSLLADSVNPAPLASDAPRVIIHDNYLLLPTAQQMIDEIAKDSFLTDDEVKQNIAALSNFLSTHPNKEFRAKPQDATSRVVGFTLPGHSSGNRATVEGKRLYLLSELTILYKSILQLANKSMYSTETAKICQLMQLLGSNTWIQNTLLNSGEYKASSLRQVHDAIQAYNQSRSLMEDKFSAQPYKAATADDDDEGAALEEEELRSTPELVRASDDDDNERTIAVVEAELARVKAERNRNYGQLPNIDLENQGKQTLPRVNPQNAASADALAAQELRLINELAALKRAKATAAPTSSIAPKPANDPKQEIRQRIDELDRIQSKKKELLQNGNFSEVQKHDLRKALKDYGADRARLLAQLNPASSPAGSYTSAISGSAVQRAATFLDLNEKTKQFVDSLVQESVKMPADSPAASDAGHGIIMLAVVLNRLKEAYPDFQSNFKDRLVEHLSSNPRFKTWFEKINFTLHFDKIALDERIVVNEFVAELLKAPSDKPVVIGNTTNKTLRDQMDKILEIIQEALGNTRSAEAQNLQGKEVDTTDDFSGDLFPQVPADNQVTDLTSPQAANAAVLKARIQRNYRNQTASSSISSVPNRSYGFLPAEDEEELGAGVSDAPLPRKKLKREPLFQGSDREDSEDYKLRSSPLTLPGIRDSSSEDDPDQDYKSVHSGYDSDADDDIDSVHSNYSASDLDDDTVSIKSTDSHDIDSNQANVGNSDADDDSYSVHSNYSASDLDDDTVSIKSKDDDGSVFTPPTAKPVPTKSPFTHRKVPKAKAAVSADADIADIDDDLYVAPQLIKDLQRWGYTKANISTIETFGQSDKDFDPNNRYVKKITLSKDAPPADQLEGEALEARMEYHVNSIIAIINSRILAHPNDPEQWTRPFTIDGQNKSDVQLIHRAIQLVGNEYGVRIKITASDRAKAFLQEPLKEELATEMQRVFAESSLVNLSERMVEVKAAKIAPAPEPVATPVSPPASPVTSPAAAPVATTIAPATTTATAAPVTTSTTAPIAAATSSTTAAPVTPTATSTSASGSSPAPDEAEPFVIRTHGAIKTASYSDDDDNDNAHTAGPTTKH